MEGKRLLNSMRLKNLLSYGSEGVTLELEPLNVLIGPNASGKSNLIEAISLLAAAPRDLLAPIREGGGTPEWIWKGGNSKMASLDVQTIHRGSPLNYGLSFTAASYRFELIDERVYLGASLNEDLDDLNPLDRIYGYDRGRPKIRTAERSVGRFKLLNDISSGQSILSQVREPDLYPELADLANLLGGIAFFREGNQGRFAASRLPQKADLPEDFLLENAGNLGLVLNDLQHRPAIKNLLLERLKDFYEDVTDISTKVQSGTVQVYLHERGLQEPIPAHRLSDGTLRYLCLLVILLHPEPPPVICIEEPELGLHPDIIRTVGKLLIEASQRTQLIVTTHSDFLVSALSEIPESVVVCERGSEGTQLRRLDPERLKNWLDKYTLGELWSMGEIGGNRW